METQRPVQVVIATKWESQYLKPGLTGSTVYIPPTIIHSIYPKPLRPYLFLNLEFFIFQKDNMVHKQNIM